jgi:hypothetical protein
MDPTKPNIIAKPTLIYPYISVRVISLLDGGLSGH